MLQESPDGTLEKGMEDTACSWQETFDTVEGVYGWHNLRNSIVDLTRRQTHRRCDLQVTHGGAEDEERAALVEFPTRT